MDFFDSTTIYHSFTSTGNLLSGRFHLAVDKSQAVNRDPVVVGTSFKVLFYTLNQKDVMKNFQMLTLSR